MDDVQRTVSAHIEATVTAGTDLVLAIAVADGPTRTESLVMTANGTAAVANEIAAPHGGRLHLVAGLPAGPLTIDYTATVEGVAPIEPLAEIDRILYARPSRYCDSDKLMPVAAAEFAGITGKPLLDAVSSWVGSQLSYVSGSSKPIDGAVDTYLSRQGVCRDYAHLVIALLRGSTCRRGWPPSMRPGSTRWTFMPSPKRTSTAPGGWWTPPRSPLVRPCCASPPDATPPTPRF